MWVVSYERGTLVNSALAVLYGLPKGDHAMLPFGSRSGPPGVACVRSERHKPRASKVLLALRYLHQGPWEGSASSEMDEAEE
jgi:hypothetical protein